MNNAVMFVVKQKSIVWISSFFLTMGVLSSFAIAAIPEPQHHTNLSVVPSEKDKKIININTGDSKGLQQLKNIGAKKAAAIIAYRQAHGRFKSINDLLKIKGINEKLLKDIAPYLAI